MKNIMIALAFFTVLSAQALAQAPTPAAPTPAAPSPATPSPAAPGSAAPTYSVATTTVADLLDKPALRAIFVKYLPTIATNPQIDEGRAMTLPDLVQYVPDIVTPDKLAAIDVELKALPPQ